MLLLLQGLQFEKEGYREELVHGHSVIFILPFCPLGPHSRVLVSKQQCLLWCWVAGRKPGGKRA